jgi:hypothetical protein
LIGLRAEKKNQNEGLVQMMGESPTQQMAGPAKTIRLQMQVFMLHAPFCFSPGYYTRMFDRNQQ